MATHLDKVACVISQSPAVTDQRAEGHHIKKELLGKSIIKEFGSLTMNLIHCATPQLALFSLYLCHHSDTTFQSWYFAIFSQFNILAITSMLILYIFCLSVLILLLTQSQLIVNPKIWLPGLLPYLCIFMSKIFPYPHGKPFKLS